MNATPTVKLLATRLREHIHGGGFQPGDFLPAEMDLASEFSVSRQTIRRAIALLEAAGDIDRRPHSRPTIAVPATAPGSRLDYGDIHVWVSHPIADEPTLRFLKGISKGLQGTPYRMVVREPSRFVGTVVMADERQFLKDVLEDQDAVGAIIQRDPFAHNEDLFPKLVARGKHLVFVDTAPPGELDADFVGTANTAAARRCVEYLHELGHSRIYCLSDSEVPRPTLERTQGYWRAMTTMGLQDQGKSILACDLPAESGLPRKTAGIFARSLANNEYFSDFASRLVTAVLNETIRPTALFVCYDVLALWVCAYLEGAGISIPHDISVVGFDWVAHWDRTLPDELTTADQSFEGFGRHAADLILDRVSAEHRLRARSVLLDAPLVIRSSTMSRLIMPDSSAKTTVGAGALTARP